MTKNYPFTFVIYFIFFVLRCTALNMCAYPGTTQYYSVGKQRSVQRTVSVVCVDITWIALFVDTTWPSLLHLFSEEKNSLCESNNNGTAFSEEKWTQGNNRQRQKWQLAKHLLSEKAEKFQTLARMAYYFHLLKKSFDAVLGMRGTMDPTPRCTGTKQRSRHGRDHNVTRRYFQQKSWNNRISAELWQIYVKRFPARRLFQL